MLYGLSLTSRSSPSPRSFFCAHFILRPDEEKSAIKKHESKFVTMDPQAMYTIDRINNGLYR